jgi:hypothetical protein
LTKFADLVQLSSHHKKEEEAKRRSNSDNGNNGRRIEYDLMMADELLGQPAI